MATDEALFSSMVRSGRTTYFIDVKEAKNGKKYLTITENRLDDGDKKTRVTVRVFKESIEQFRQAVDEAASAVSN
jgi:3-hydroxymyristoyl/3-hydroxydecanoyl-(acyl carrier protein) dehydratase